MIWKVHVTLSVVALAIAAPSFAGVAPPPPAAAVTGSNQTTAFVGLNWVFGSGEQTVEGILGVAYGEVDAAGDVTGAKGALHFRLNDGIVLRQAKLTGLFGDTDVQAEVGGGFNFETGSPIGILGANGDYFAIGADLSFNGILEGYVGVHSIGDFE